MILYTEQEINKLSQYTGLNATSSTYLFLLPSKSLKCKYFIEEPLEDMPLYISNDLKAYSELARWRLDIGK